MMKTQRTAIPKSKIGDCSNPGCNNINTACVKVGKELFCIKCRNHQKTTKTISKQNVRKKTNKAEESTRIYLIHELDDVVSKYIRKREADKNGNVHCFTCNWVGHWKQADCGHFISRKIYQLRWDVRNLKPQCKMCNQFLDGNIEIYSINLDREMPDLSNILKEESRSISKMTQQDMKELLIDFRYKLKMVESKYK